MDSSLTKPPKGREAVRFHTRVPMRYITKSPPGKKPQEAVATNMSSTGIRFETEEDLAEGTIAAVEILLFGNKPVKAIGKVIRAASVQREGGRCYEIAFSFTKISDAAKEQINMWYYSERLDLKSVGHSLRHGDRRKTERFSVIKSSAKHRKRRILLRGAWHPAEIKNISKSGLMVATEAAAKSGETWEMIIHLIVYKEPIRIAGKVIRVKKEGAISNVAVKFNKIDESDSKKLSKSVYTDRLFLLINEQRSTNLIWKKLPQDQSRRIRNG